jgi:DNA-binding MarR family transcriptional regulator
VQTNPPEVPADVLALESLTRALVAVAWDSAHAAPPGMTFPQTRLLLFLSGLGRVPSSALATAMGVNASSVTRLADKLAEHGYLVRGADQHKRSVVTLELTPAGADVVTDVLARRHSTLAALLDRLPTDVRGTVPTLAAHLTTAATSTPAVTHPGPGPL